MSLVGDRHQVTLLIFKIPEKVSSRCGGCWRPTGGRTDWTPVYELLSSILPAAAAALGQSPDLEQASHFIFIGWHNERCIVITGSGEENTNGEEGVKL